MDRVCVCTWLQPQSEETESSQSAGCGCSVCSRPGLDSSVRLPARPLTFPPSPLLVQITGRARPSGGGRRALAACGRSRPSHVASRMACEWEEREGGSGGRRASWGGTAAVSYGLSSPANLTPSPSRSSAAGQGRPWPRWARRRSRRKLFFPPSIKGARARAPWARTGLSPGLPDSGPRSPAVSAAVEVASGALHVSHADPLHAPHAGGLLQSPLLRRRKFMGKDSKPRHPAAGSVPATPSAKPPPTVSEEGPLSSPGSLLCRATRVHGGMITSCRSLRLRRGTAPRQALPSRQRGEREGGRHLPCNDGEGVLRQVVPLSRVHCCAVGQGCACAKHLWRR